MIGQESGWAIKHNLTTARYYSKDEDRWVSRGFRKVSTWATEEEAEQFVAFMQIDDASVVFIAPVTSK